MLRRSSCNRIFMANMCQGPHARPPIQEDYDNAVVRGKLLGKSRKYYMSDFMKDLDREHMYRWRGGVKARHVLQRTVIRDQHQHWNQMYNSWEIKIEQEQSQMSPCAYPIIMNQNGRHELNNNGRFNVNWCFFNREPFKYLDKQQAINLMQQQGMFYTVIDEYTNDDEDYKYYFKANLYSDNFPWVKDPETTPQKGDADYDWKGTETFDYSNKAEMTKMKNEFQTLWKIPAPKKSVPATK